jgi:hypothetical protein
MRREEPTNRTRRALVLISLTPTLLVFMGVIGARHSGSISLAPGRWTPSQLITPERLVKELARPRSQRPRVVCVGFAVLYRGAHIPGARYAGPARQSSGIAELRKWAASVPRQTPIVIYCGCCPMKQCPNIRPAYAVLQSERFTRVRVLDLPNSFAKDWVEKGYPVVRGQ